MKVRIVLAVLALAMPGALAAERWKEIDRLPGDIAVDLDEDSLSQAMDGTNEVVFATFRRHMPTGIMESDVAVNCANATAKLRGLRLVNGTQVYNQQLPLTNDYHEVGFGSSEAIYFRALCGREIPPPEGYVVDEAPVIEETAAEGAHPLDDNPAIEDDTEETEGQ